MANENKKELPMWKRIKQGEKLPCQSFLRKYDGEILRLTTTGGVTVGQDCFYLPVENVIEEIRKFPIEESEDERIINNIRKVIGLYRGMFTEKSLMPEQYQEIDAWLEKQGDKKPILDVEIPFGAKDSELEEVTYDIPKGYHAEIEDNKVVIKKGNKKSSWSEEDEEIISVLNAYTEVAENDDCPLNAEKIRKAICKLKSLRPQSQWRPSEEEMKALEFCLEHNIDKDGVFGSKVVKLFEKLKKLTK